MQGKLPWVPGATLRPKSSQVATTMGPLWRGKNFRKRKFYMFSLFFVVHAASAEFLTKISN